MHTHTLLLRTAHRSRRRTTTTTLARSEPNEAARPPSASSARCCVPRRLASARSVYLCGGVWVSSSSGSSMDDRSIDRSIGDDSSSRRLSTYACVDGCQHHTRRSSPTPRFHRMQQHPLQSAAQQALDSHRHKPRPRPRRKEVAGACMPPAAGAQPRGLGKQRSSEDDAEEHAAAVPTVAGAFPCPQRPPFSRIRTPQDPQSTHPSLAHTLQSHHKFPNRTDSAAFQERGASNPRPAPRLEPSILPLAVIVIVNVGYSNSLLHFAPRP